MFRIPLARGEVGNPSGVLGSLLSRMSSGLTCFCFSMCGLKESRGLFGSDSMADLTAPCCLLRWLLGWVLRLRRWASSSTGEVSVWGLSTAPAKARADVENFEMRKEGDAIDAFVCSWKARSRLHLSPVLPAFILTDNSGPERGC